MQVSAELINEFLKMLFYLSIDTENTNDYEKLKVFRQNNPNNWPKARGDKSEKPLYQF